MRRREFIGLLAGAAAASPLGARAQQTRKILRIGTLAYGPVSNAAHQWRALRERLRELGYVEGENIAFESRWAEGKVERLPELAADLVRLKVDVIVAATVPGALAAKDATKTIPIVFWAVSDPVRFGLVPSLARPGGNITGVSGLSLDLAGKRLELLREIVPEVSRFAVLWHELNVNSRFFAKETEAAARTLGISLQTVSVRDRNEFREAFSAMRRERAGALIVAPDAMLQTERRRLADLALENKLPTIFSEREFVEVGGLMAYAANQTDDARRAAVHLAKILKGAKPADLPVDQATKFELVVNLKTAKVLGLTIPESFLLRADEVIE
jgi:putative ABC transport system substrate-binding protein